MSSSKSIQTFGGEIVEDAQYTGKTLAAPGRERFKGKCPRSFARAGKSDFVFRSVKGERELSFRIGYR